MKRLFLLICLIVTFSFGLRAQDHSPEEYVSGSMPYISINTENMAEIKDKINYIPASFSLNLPENELAEMLGSEISDAKIQIRGRGNWTWQKSPKRAYKIKFDKKTSLLGMPKNKHFALISYDPYYTTLWLAPLVGMQLGRLAEFGWVPKMQPVEVSLNGEYMGIYLFVETIRSDEERLDIQPQEELCEDPAKIPYGWIIELDNQKDDCQIQVPSLNKNGHIKVTYKEPENLSEMQQKWLTEEFERLTNLIEKPEEFPSETWIKYFDLNSLAKYMIIRELLHDVDGYSGSQYFYKDFGSELWTAGPLWDCELWPNVKKDWISYDGAWSILNWIPFMMRSAELRDAFVEEWDNFYNGRFEEIFDFLDFLTIYEGADLANTRRWPSEEVSLQNKIDACKNSLIANAEWIEENKFWESEYYNSIKEIEIDDLVEIKAENKTIHVRSKGSVINKITVYNLSGLTMFDQAVNETNIRVSGLNTGLFIIQIETEGSHKPVYRKIML